MTEKNKSHAYINNLIEQIKRYPKDTELRVNLGEAYLLNGQIQKAREAFQKAMELDPNSGFSSAVWEWSGYMHKKEFDSIKAITDYTQWAQADPGSAAPLDRLGTVFIKSELTLDLQLLLSMYKKRHEATEDPALLESMALLSCVMEPTIQTEDESVLSLTGAALEQLYNSLPLHYIMGLLYARSGNVNGAITEFLKVQALDTEHTWQETRFGLNWTSETANLELGKVLEAADMPSEAISRYKECLKLNNFHTNVAILARILALLLVQENERELIKLFDEAKAFDQTEKASENEPAEESGETAVQVPAPKTAKTGGKSRKAKNSASVINAEPAQEPEDENAIPEIDTAAAILAAKLAEKAQESIFKQLFGELDKELQKQIASILQAAAEGESEHQFKEKTNLQILCRIYAYALFKCGSVSRFNALADRELSSGVTVRSEDLSLFIELFEEVNNNKASKPLNPSQKTSLKNRREKALELYKSRSYLQAERSFKALMEKAKSWGQSEEYARAAIGCAKAQLAQQKYDEALATSESVLQEDFIKNSLKSEIFDLMASCFKQRGREEDLRSRRLCLLQKISIARSENAETVNRGIIVPVPDSLKGEAAFIAVQACRGGHGELLGTPFPGFEATVSKTWNYLKAQALNLGLPDLTKYDICIETRSENNTPLQEDTGPEADKENMSEDFSLGLLAAIVCAVKNITVRPNTLILGSLDLLGNIYASPFSCESLYMILKGGRLEIKQLIIPELLTDNLHNLPLEVLTVPTFALAKNVPQLIETLEQSNFTAKAVKPKSAEE
ncbi:tetratricopeptide repeat protein [bacterium]|nr:tetratricopeptide repeat protein [bacterium]